MQKLLQNIIHQRLHVKKNFNPGVIKLPEEKLSDIRREIEEFLSGATTKITANITELREYIDRELREIYVDIARLTTSMGAMAQIPERVGNLESKIEAKKTVWNMYFPYVLAGIVFILTWFLKDIIGGKIQITIK